MRSACSLDEPTVRHFFAGVYTWQGVEGGRSSRNTYRKGKGSSIGFKYDNIGKGNAGVSLDPHPPSVVAHHPGDG